jgi:hypothetical protein
MNPHFSAFSEPPRQARAIPRRKVSLRRPRDRNDPVVVHCSQTKRFVYQMDRMPLGLIIRLNPLNPIHRAILMYTNRAVQVPSF